MRPTRQVLEVWGELACFTRPEFKVERFSYPLITPSAARGIFDAIYCKPTKMRWQVTRIEVLAQPRYMALRRNEVKGKVPSYRAIGQWMQGKAEPQPLWADGEDEATGRTQRQTTALKNVKYRLHAQVHAWPGCEGELQAMEAQFRRRASRGQCFQQPYLGCREFAAYFRLVEEQSPEPPPVAYDADLGLMLYDVFDLSRPGGSTDGPSVSLFHAVVRGGVLDVPPYEGEEVLKPVVEEVG
jgi:CRISPR-associated protein Cas5d